MNVADPNITTPMRTVSTTSPPPWRTARRGHTGWQFGQTALVISVGAHRPSHPMRVQACPRRTARSWLVDHPEVTSLLSDGP
jgi:hypothetical protein